MRRYFHIFRTRKKGSHGDVEKQFKHSIVASINPSWQRLLLRLNITSSAPILHRENEIVRAWNFSSFSTQQHTAP
jgi:hypothetical protein